MPAQQHGFVEFCAVGPHAWQFAPDCGERWLAAARWVDAGSLVVPALVTGHAGKLHREYVHVPVCVDIAFAGPVAVVAACREKPFLSFA